jgi:hypothetical protein
MSIVETTAWILKTTVKLGLMPISLSPLSWFTAYNVSVMEQQPHSKGEKALGVIFPNWFSAFKIAKFAPERTTKNNLRHFLGAAIFPMQYSAFQLAKLKNSKASDGEKTLALITGPAYSVFASSAIKERQSLGFTTGKLARQPKSEPISPSPGSGPPQASRAVPQTLGTTPFSSAHYSPILMR